MSQNYSQDPTGSAFMPMHLSEASHLFRKLEKASQSMDCAPTPATDFSAPKPNPMNKEEAENTTSKASDSGPSVPSGLQREPPQDPPDNNRDAGIEGDHVGPCWICKALVPPPARSTAGDDAGGAPEDGPSPMSAGARLFHECEAIRRSDVFPLRAVPVEDEDEDGVTVSRVPVPATTPVQLERSQEDKRER